MSDHSLDEFIFQLSEAHAQLNDELFKGKLNKIKISVERPKRSDSNKRAFFQAGGNMYGEDTSIITIVTTSLDGDYFAILSTLVHEMIHQYCFENEIQDGYSTNLRHNKNFRDVAEHIGWRYYSGRLVGQQLKIQRKRHGYAHADLYKDEYKDTINNLSIDRKLIENFIHDDSKANAVDKKVFNVYQCPKCLITVRNQKEIRLMCMDCNKELKQIK